MSTARNPGQQAVKEHGPALWISRACLKFIMQKKMDTPKPSRKVGKTKEPWKVLLERLWPIVQERLYENEEYISDLKHEKSEDLALALEQLKPEEAIEIFKRLSEKQASEVLGKVDPELSKYFTKHIKPEEFPHLIERLPVREAGDVAAGAPKKDVDAFLATHKDKKSKRVKEIQIRREFKEGTAGRLMTTDYVRIEKDFTATQALETVRKTHRNVDIPDDLYVASRQVTNNHTEYKLEGVISIRDVVMAEPHTKIANIMEPNVISISVDADENEAANLISKYGFLALPVTDENHLLKGVIPADELIKIVVSKLNSRYAQAVGTDAEEMQKLSPLQAARKRVPWLVGTMAIELGSGVIIAHFNHVLQQVILLASFLPVMSAVSGNVGLQAAAITVRALDTGHVSAKQWWEAVGKEALTTLFMALACGFILGAVGYIWSHRFPFGLVIGTALTVAMITAGFMGTIIPIISKKIGFDPATTAGPFETAFQDVIGFSVFLWLASILLPWIK